MPKSDTWPGGVAMEPLSNLDSAGSCDSVISVNSGYSQDSMEHLSPEERACLMFFEETIEALEVQEDSGLSNDEPESVFPAGPEVNGVSSLTSNASKEDQTARPGTNVFSIKDQAEHHAPNHTSEPQSFPTAAANMNDLETPMHPVNPPKNPVTESTADCKVLPSASQVCVAMDGDGHLAIVPRAGPRPGVSDEASQIDVGVIPPPSDFMDQPVTPPRPQKVEELLPSTRISNEKPGAPVEQGPPNEPPKLSLPAPSSCLLMSPPRSPEPRSPPAVAPKPKKLPTNIVLKSHKAGVDVSKDHSEHLVHNSSDRLMPDPQRVRIEALRKLGLLPAEADPGPASPRSRSSWATPLSPIGLKPPLTPPYTCVNSSSPARVPSQSPAAAPPSATSTAPAGQPAAVMPAPPAFSDSVGPPLSGNEPRAAGGASEARVNARMSAPPHTSPAPVKHPTPSKVVRAKSATLERPGLGQSSYADGPDSTKAGQPHRNRVRQASLGGLKEFTGAGREAPAVGRTDGREPEFRRSLPAHHGPQPFGEASKKLPRSQGISVLICPRAENEGDRRQALKKLGLLRD